MDLNDITQLPFEIQLVLASGYLAYKLATTGLDRSHKTSDVVFQVFAYGSIAYPAYLFVAGRGYGYWAVAIAFIASALGAALWRSFVRSWVVAALKKTGVTRENYVPSTWDHILQARQNWAYVSVELANGERLESNLSSLPQNMPLGAADLDTAGNIAIYVTRAIDTDGDPTDFELTDGLDAQGLAALTYIPASQINSVTVSFMGKEPPATASFSAS